MNEIAFDMIWLSKLTFIAFYAEIEKGNSCCSEDWTTKAKQGKRERLVWTNQGMNQED